jgi:hypothetical protein
MLAMRADRRMAELARERQNTEQADTTRDETRKQDQTNIGKQPNESEATAKARGKLIIHTAVRTNQSLRSDGRGGLTMRKSEGVGVIQSELEEGGQSRNEGRVAKRTLLIQMIYDLIQWHTERVESKEWYRRNGRDGGVAQEGG